MTRRIPCPTENCLFNVMSDKEHAFLCSTRIFSSHSCIFIRVMHPEHQRARPKALYHCPSKRFEEAGSLLHSSGYFARIIVFKALKTKFPDKTGNIIFFNIFKCTVYFKRKNNVLYNVLQGIKRSFEACNPAGRRKF